MEIRDLVDALLRYDALAARAWILEATRRSYDWSAIPRPDGLDPLQMAVAAGVVELIAERSGSIAPMWTADVPAAPEPRFLVKSAESMPRLRKSCEESGPEPLRRRRLYAPEEFLTLA